MANVSKYAIRILLLVGGVMIMALGGSFLLLSNFGGDAILVFQQGVSKLMGFSMDNIGYGILIINVAFSIVMVILDRKMLNIGTVIVSLLMGTLIQLVVTFNLLSAATSLFSQILMSVAGCIILSIGVTLYLHANLGYAPFEGILIIIQKRFKIRFGLVKIVSDLTLFLIGWALGGVIGIGSVLTIIIVGPAIDFFMKLVNKIIPKNKLGY